MKELKIIDIGGWVDSAGEFQVGIPRVPESVYRPEFNGIRYDNYLQAEKAKALYEVNEMFRVILETGQVPTNFKNTMDTLYHVHGGKNSKVWLDSLKGYIPS